MSWLKVPLFGGVLKVKPTSQLRGIEIRRQVPMLSLGLVHVSWWGRETIAREERLNREVD